MLCSYLVLSYIINSLKMDYNVSKMWLEFFVFF